VVIIQHQAFFMHYKKYRLFLLIFMHKHYLLDINWLGFFEGYFELKIKEKVGYKNES